MKDAISNSELVQREAMAADGRHLSLGAVLQSFGPEPVDPSDHISNTPHAATTAVPRPKTLPSSGLADKVKTDINMLHIHVVGCISRKLKGGLIVTI